MVAAASAYSQGLINFNNKVSSISLDAPITYAAGGPATAGKIDGGATLTVDGYNWGGAAAMAALYGGPAGTPEQSLTLLVPAVAFRAGTAAGYVSTTLGSSRTVEGVLAGAPAVFQVRAWDVGVVGGASSYEAAVAINKDAVNPRGVYYGASGLVNVAQLGGGSIQTPNLVGLTAFAMDFHPVPEPSIIGLGILGAVAGLMVFRRRQ